MLSPERDAYWIARKACVVTRPKSPSASGGGSVRSASSTVPARAGRSTSGSTIATAASTIPSTTARSRPHVFRSPLGRQRHILEYQVRQTPKGAEIAVRCIGPADLPKPESEISSGLARLGLLAPEVVVVPVDQIERQSSGKLKRFVSLARTPIGNYSAIRQGSQRRWSRSG
jgi:hypothetical protein